MCVGVCVCGVCVCVCVCVSFLFNFFSWPTIAIMSKVPQRLYSLPLMSKVPQRLYSYSHKRKVSKRSRFETVSIRTGAFCPGICEENVALCFITRVFVLRLENKQNKFVQKSDTVTVSATVTMYVICCVNGTIRAVMWSMYK